MYPKYLLTFLLQKTTLRKPILHQTSLKRNFGIWYCTDFLRTIWCGTDDLNLFKGKSVLPFLKERKVVPAFLKKYLKKLGLSSFPLKMLEEKEGVILPPLSFNNLNIV